MRARVILADIQRQSKGKHNIVMRNLETYASPAVKKTSHATHFFIIESLSQSVQTETTACDKT